jgi:photosystem II stability/assembly factor-like uncharacterized protein
MKTKLLSLIILFFSICHLCAQSKSSNGWFWQYPKPQGNTLRDIYVFNKDTAIAVGDLSTIIKTTDGGKNWDVQHHAGGSGIELNSVNFIDAQNGWAAGGAYESGQNVLLKTSDSGKNWLQVKTDTTLPYNSVYFVDSDTGFVFGEDGIILRTTNGGNNWDTRSIDNYIGAYLDVFRFLAVTFIDKNTGWVVGYGYYGNEIFKTTDCGRSWQWNEQIITPKDYHSLNDIYFLDKNHGFIVGDVGAFIKTTDGGNTWQYSDLNKDGEYLNFSSVFFTDSLKGWITASSSSINEYPYGDLILKTIDGGDNWTIVDSNKWGVNNNVAQLFKVRFSDKSDGWIVGQFGVIYRTTDAGNNWISQREDKHTFNSIYFVDENTGWAVGDSGTILNTTDGGDNWEKQYFDNDLLLKSIKAIDLQNIITVGGATIKNLGTYKAAILKSSDGGKNWGKLTIDSVGYLNSISFSSRQIGYAVGYILDKFGMIKTSDGGLTWYAQNSFLVGGSRDVQFINGNIGWISSYDSVLYKTTDGGNSWFQQTINSNLSNISFYFVNSNLGWVTGDYYLGQSNIYKTTNGGNSWSPSGITFPGNNFTISFINETIGWITGSNYLSSQKSILKTTDGGGTWVIQDIPSNFLTDIFFVNENTGWAVGDGIFKTTNGGGIMSVKGITNSGNIPKQITLYQNYPNPFNPSTVISWQLTSNSHVTLKVYDILGREIATLVNKDLNTGSHSINWDASKIASGVYFYRLSVQSIDGQKNGSYIKTKKMILLR